MVRRLPDGVLAALGTLVMLAGGVVLAVLCYVTDGLIFGLVAIMCILYIVWRILYEVIHDSRKRDGDR